MGTILTEIIGNLGVITLNRPKALNSLNLEMCQAITTAMVRWERDDTIGAVLVRGAGGKAFCAGGDVVMLHDSGKKDSVEAEQFWRVEYALNDLIQRYSKPYIALIDGIVMGGGVGLSVHGRHRIAGDQTMFAMPETGIGYFPDVGGTYFLPRLGQATAMWLGLTGARLKTAQACQIGVANSYVPSGSHAGLVTALGAAKLGGTDGDVVDVISKFVKRPPQSPLDISQLEAFSHRSVRAIFNSLEQDGSEWANKQISILKSKSPLALAVTHQALTQGAQLSFREAMTRELDISLNFLKTQDFFEGVRALLIDKDRNPKWSHDSVADVTQAQVERLFRQNATPPLKFLA